MEVKELFTKNVHEELSFVSNGDFSKLLNSKNIIIRENVFPSFSVINGEININMKTIKAVEEYINYRHEHSNHIELNTNTEYCRIQKIIKPFSIKQGTDEIYMCGVMSIYYNNQTKIITITPFRETSDLVNPNTLIIEKSLSIKLGGAIINPKIIAKRRYKIEGINICNIEFCVANEDALKNKQDDEIIDIVINNLNEYIQRNDLSITVFYKDNSGIKEYDKSLRHEDCITKLWEFELDSSLAQFINDKLPGLEYSLK